MKKKYILLEEEMCFVGGGGGRGEGIGADREKQSFTNWDLRCLQLLV
jgi:hypothetical protein